MNNHNKFLILIFAFMSIFSMQVNASIIVPKTSSDSTESGANYMEANRFVNLTVDQFEKLSSTHLNFFQRVFFRKAQKQVRKELREHHQVDLHEYYDTQKGKFKFDLLWFTVGAIIGPFAMLFSYLTKQPKSQKISALIGFGVFILWFGFLFLF